MNDYISPIIWIAERYLKYNPFFIYEGKTPLLHQTEIVAKSLFIKPTRMLIADVIGLGKTIIGLRILKTINNYRKLNRVLIAVPSVLVDQWIDEMRSMGIMPQIIERKMLSFLKSHLVLPSGWYIGSMDTLKRPEYIEVIRRNKWDAIVVDEAHKLGLLGGEPNLRWLNLGELIRDNRDALVLLLSATPHRGKANDYLARLALLDPTLLEVTNIGALERIFDRPEYYQHTHGFMVFRRSKEDVNRVYEGREIFKPCNMMAVLVEPNEVERRLLRNVTELAVRYLSRYYSYMMQTLGWKTGRAQSIVSLLRTLLVKRGLSSPQALVKTFSKLVEKRGRFMYLIEKGYSPEEAEEEIASELERIERRFNELLTGDIGEYDEELDAQFDNIASYFDKYLDENFRNKLRDAVEDAKKILKGEVEDSKLETLKRILNLAFGTSQEELPEGFEDLVNRKVIVFSEFKDTAYYIYDRIRNWIEEEFRDKDAVRLFTSDNRGDIEKIKNWLSGEGKKVLITTDVAGEGLNLQHANVLVNYEIAWSPMRIEQRIGRVWRYGQNKITYVFNLFLADALEREVAEVVFAKLYGINISLGKLEPIIGEKVFLSTIRNELLEHSIEERAAIGELIPVEIDFKGKKYSVSEPRIIDLVARDAKAFVNAFIKALMKLVREVKLKKIYPPTVEAERVRSELRYLTGFRETEEALKVAKNLLNLVAWRLDARLEYHGMYISMKLKDGKILDFPINNPEEIIKGLIRYFREEDGIKYFVFLSDDEKLFLLSELEILFNDEVRYIEPIGILADVKSKSLNILRGVNLLDEFSRIFKRAIIVDEIYGLDFIESLISKIIDSSHSSFYAREMPEGILKLIKVIREYQDFKDKVKGLKFFNSEDPKVNIKIPKIILISSAFLPEAGERLSEEVWQWAEEEAMPIVLEYEKLNNREPIRVSGHEPVSYTHLTLPTN